MTLIKVSLNLQCFVIPEASECFTVDQFDSVVVKKPASNI